MNPFNLSLMSVNTVFEPSRLEGHIAKSESRAGAILQIVQHLVDSGDTPIHEVRAAIRRQQNHQAAHMLHTLNGSVANLGGCRVCELAAELERLLDRDGPLLVIEDLVTCLEREFQLFLKSASQWLERQQAQRNLQLHHRSREARLTELCECLADNDLRAFDLFDELQTLLQSRMAEVDFTDFRAALHSLNFSIALGYVQTTTGH
ncbi:MAG: Hpt domain-containing protein [Cellvibrionaceae bacterium]|nr:Hpt domain-containing protein [Cellvibrionaceae bacterium]